ncbi:MAG TPA: DUF6603 domain-containing protein [Solirubrobacterales bacterium]|nr:DUF6603 domain-containing protein [Solirubrobacterales bacterium]
MFEADDLGVLSDAAVALGLLDGAGEVRGDWFEKPAEYMGGVLADDGQRQALLEFCDEVLGAGEREAEGPGPVWLPLIAGPERLQLFAVIDDSDPSFVAIGSGIRQASAEPEARVEAHVPLFRVARKGSSGPVAPIFAGQPGARATVAAAISFGEGKAGQPHLGGIELGLDLPTAPSGDTDPAISLALLGLALPGDGDVRLSTADRNGLDRTLLELVLGLVREQSTGAGGQVAALAELIGLGEAEAIPSLPMAELFDEGPRALAAWFHEVASADAARRAWLAALGELLEAEAAVAEDELRFALGDAEVAIGLGLAGDAGGLPLVVPRVSLRVGGADDRQAVLRAELLRLEAATASVTALPSLAAYAQLGGEGAPLLAGDPEVGSLRAGIALEATKPVVVLAVDDVTLAGTKFETLDLTSPGAVAEAAGKTVESLLAGAFERIGPSGRGAMTLLGLQPPPGHPGVPTLDPGQFLQDPIAALRDHWRELVEKQRAAIPALLEAARDLLVGDAQAAAGASGSGSDEDPWRIGLREGIELRAVAEAGGLTLALAVGSEHELGKELDFRGGLTAALVHLDLTSGGADFLPGAAVSLQLRPGSASQGTLELGSARLLADRFELAAGWTPAAGVSLRAGAPGLSLDNGKKVPLDLTDWGALERLAGLLVEAGPLPAELARALGWAQDAGPRLALDVLAEDPQEALLEWLGAVAAEAESTAASALATALGGASGDGRVGPVAWTEAAAAASSGAERARAGVRLPFEVAAGKVVAAGHLDLGAIELDLSGPTPALRAGGAIRAELGIFRRDGPLVDEGELKLGRVDAEMRLPFGEGEAAVALVLTDAAAFGARRERWELGEGEDAAPLLPEVRALLTAAAAELADLDPVAELLTALRLLVDGGFDYEALGYLLRDPRGFAREIAAAGEAELLKAVAGLVGELDGVAFDSRDRRLGIDLGGTGGAEQISWTGEVSLDAAGAVEATAEFGAVEADAAAPLRLQLSTDPLRLTVLCNRSGDSAERIELLPEADAGALAALARTLIPAALFRHALEELRGSERELAAKIDPLLAALGLLEEGRVALVLRPAAELLAPEKARDLLEALAPSLGASFSQGRLRLADGVAVAVAGAAGQPRLDLEVDTAALLPGAAKGRIAVEAGGRLLLDAAAPLAGFTLAAAVPEAGTLELEAGQDGTKVGLRRKGGATLPLYPERPGLAELLGSGAGVALAGVLDALAAAGAGGAAARARESVLAFGDALGLRKGGSFDSDRLLAFAQDPGKEAIAALKGLGAEELKGLAAGLQEAMPPGAEIAAEKGRLRLKLGTTTIELKPDPLELGVEAADRIEPIGPLAAAVRFRGDRVTEVRGELGPAAVELAGGTLRPLLRVAAGAEPDDGRRVELGLAFDADAADRLSARWDLASDLELLVFAAGKPSEDAAAVALGALRALADPLAGIVLGAEETKELLGKEVGKRKGKVRELLEGVLLEPGHPDRLIADPFDLGTLPERLLRLARNLGGLEPELELERMKIGAATLHDRLGMTVEVGPGRFELVAGEVAVALEADGGWIDEELPPGLFVGGLTDAGFEPAFACAGLGIRVYRPDGPLLDAGLSLGSVAVRAFADLQPQAEGAGGVQVQLTELGVSAGSAGGGNPVGQGLLAKAGGGGKLEPALSPALAVQRYGKDVRVKLTGGDGDGPWWQPVQTAFGPLYVERVGLTADNSENRLKEVGLAIDGRVALAGFQAAFDDLSVACRFDGGRSVFDPGSWSVDLGGLALTGSVAGVSVSGGLRKLERNGSVEYLGTLSGRYAVYGISVYGGYGEAGADGSRYATFFAFGALNAPIGGPPAFFITGIGGGIGINRGLELPESFAEIAETPFIKALDPQAGVGSDPSKDFDRLAAMFPAAADQYWIAAGVSFTSFALVEGVAVISVAVGEGVEVAMLGLGRMALPRPEAPLASIELGLVARFSTREPVLWVQAQLTDNSWLLSRDVKLTGGYAYVVWFGGPRAGEFVLTLGGYHPDFRRDGYPEVPRLGVSWKVGSSIVVKGEGYFALTSEAVMAGGLLEASADFGWAWAAVSFSADGIVFFDPGHFLVEALATVSAGIKIKIPFKTIRVSAHLSSRVKLEGPPFHGVARFEVATHEIKVAFGDQGRPELVYLDWPGFVVKYLEAGSDGAARVLSAVTGRGALAPPPAADGAAGATPDGSVERPFEVMPEFELTVTTTVPTESIAFGDPGQEVAPAEAVPPSHSLGIAPLGLGLLQSTLRLRLRGVDGAGGEQIAVLQRVPLREGRFPLGVWGPPSEPERVPRGEVLAAADGVYLKAEAELREPLPAPVAYDKVELGKDKPRLPLPLGGPKRAPKLKLPPEEPPSPVAPTLPPPRVLELRADQPLLSGGQIEVRKMAAPRRDVDPAADRPSLETASGSRAIVLGFGGEILADSAADSVEIPQGGERVAVVEEAALAGSAGLHGWHAGARLAYVGRGTALFPGGSIHVPLEALPPVRRGTDSGWVDAVELTRAAAFAETRFREPLRAVAVALDRIGEGGPQPEPELAGAVAAGERVSLQSGDRTYLVYPLEPQAEGVLTVTLERREGWSIGGVLASESATAAEFATQLGER